MITDPSLDDVKVSGTTLRALMGGFTQRVPSVAALDQAMLAFDDPSPAMLESYACWVDLLAELRPVLSRVQLLQWCARAWAGELPGCMQVAPSDEVIELLLVEPDDGVRQWLREVRDAAVAGRLVGNLELLGALAASHVDEPAPLRLITFYTRPGAMRALLERAAEAERAEWLRDHLAVATLKARSGRGAGEFIGHRVEHVLPVLDLCRSAAGRAAAAEAFAELARLPDLAKEAARILDGGRFTPPPRPSAATRQARAYLDERYAQHRRGAALPALAAACAGRAVAVADADELRDLQRWLAASDERRRAIAARVAAALGGAFALVPGTGPFAAFQHAPSATRFVLLPGGTLTMGLTSAEEELLRAAAQQARGRGNYDEQFGILLDQLDEMRPVHEVRIAPLLVSQSPLGAAAIAALAGQRGRRRKRADEPAVVPLATIADVLERSAFRLLSEAEREYAARGAIAGQLTPLGHAVPGEELLEALAGPAGPFGLRELGTLPEVCADVYAPGYAAAPRDGSPAGGTGLLVVRGGASWVSPWQDCGEWQLLCSAVRTTITGWGDKAALRLALGVRVT